MKEFFDTMYGWTSTFYGTKLDTFLFTESEDCLGSGVGYLHMGWALIIFALVVCAVYYYIWTPIQKKTLWWIIFAGINAIINFFFGLWYTMTPLVNNEVPESSEWTSFDCVGFCFTNMLWSFVAFVIASLVIKWWSINKYVPFKLF